MGDGVHAARPGDVQGQRSQKAGIVDHGFRHDAMVSTGRFLRILRDAPYRRSLRARIGRRYGDETVGAKPFRLLSRFNGDAVGHVRDGAFEKAHGPVFDELAAFRENEGGS